MNTYTQIILFTDTDGRAKFREEPLPAVHPFWRHPKITVTPHTSARTLREESIAQIAGKIRALQRGEPIAGVVDPARGY